MKLSNLIALLTNRTVAGNAYVKDGELYQGNTSQAILVKNENELNEVKKHVAPGSIAYTAGYSSMWQLSAAGSWEAIQEEGGGGFAPDITNPQDGDTLVYNATAGKWVNGSGGGGVLSVTATEGVCDKTAGEIYAAFQQGLVLITAESGSNQELTEIVVEAEKELNVYNFAVSTSHGRLTYSCVGADEYPVDNS